MKKISITFLLLVIFTLSSCDYEEDGVILTDEKTGQMFRARKSGCNGAFYLDSLKL